MSWQVRIPRAVQLVIDDVGWREGWRLDAAGGPYRAGIDRLLGPADYQAIADLGQRLDIRPTAALVLCEWDRENVCARQPTSTMAGAAWDNSARRGDWSEAAAQCFVERAAHLELALHGVGHEHWDEGVMTRAEWYGRPASKWAWSDLLGHLDVYRAILDQHGLGPAAGHSFPQHFIPCAFSYLWDEADPTDTGALVSGAGVRYVSTPFGSLDRRSPLLAPDGGLNHGLLAIDRGSNGVPWDACDRVPTAVPGEQPPVDTSALDALQAEAVALTQDEVDILLARRVLGAEADLRRLAAGHLRVLADAVRLHAGRGVALDRLVEVGRAALDDALRAYVEDRGLALDTFAEARIRRALAHTALAQLAGGAPPPAAPGGSICGIHWPNLLRLDPVENHLAVDRWVAFLARVGAQPGQLLATNAREAFAQWAYTTFGRVEGLADGFVLDLTGVPEAVLAALGDLPVIVEVDDYQRLGRCRSATVRPVWLRREGGRAFLALRHAGRRREEVRFDDAAGPLQPVVYRSGTTNVLDLRATADGLELDVEAYGTQVLTLAPGFPPRAVEVITGRLEAHLEQVNPALGVATVRVAGHDHQGECGTLRVWR